MEGLKVAVKRSPESNETSNSSNVVSTHNQQEDTMNVPVVSPSPSSPASPLRKASFVLPSSLNRIQVETVAFRDAACCASELGDEHLLKTLTVLLEGWLKMSNVSQVASDVGNIVSKALDPILLSTETPWHPNTNTAIHTIFNALAKQPKEVYIPLLSKLASHDVALGFKLLSYSTFFWRETLMSGMYLTWTEAHGGKEVVSSTITNDLRKSKSLDLAFAMASGTAVQRSTSATEHALTQVLPTLCQTIPHLVVGKDGIIQFVAQEAITSSLFGLTCRMARGEFKLVGEDRFVPVLLMSSSWPTYAQASLWEMVLHELEVPPNRLQIIASLVKKMVACIDPTDNPEAIRGLTSLLRTSRPDGPLIACLLNMPSTFAIILDTVWIIWLNRYPRQLHGFVTQKLNEALVHESKQKEIVDLVCKLREHDGKLLDDPGLKALFLKVTTNCPVYFSLGPRKKQKI